MAIARAIAPAASATSAVQTAPSTMMIAGATRCGVEFGTPMPIVVKTMNRCVVTASGRLYPPASAATPAIGTSASPLHHRPAIIAEQIAARIATPSNSISDW